MRLGYKSRPIQAKRKHNQIEIKTKLYSLFFRDSKYQGFNVIDK